jgi:hypothetical protein
MASQQVLTQKTLESAEVERDRKAELNDMANEAQVMGFDSGRGFLHLQRVAAVFSKSKMVPKQFQDNIPDCCIALNLARRLNADELMVMQNLYIVYGRPGWSSKFKIAMFNQTGKFTPINYQFFGEKGKDSYGCRAVCVNRETGEPVTGPDITIALAKAEGWYDRKSKDGGAASKWPTMTDLMLRYRSAAWMIDTTAPELTMGIGTVEEHVDAGELLEDVVAETERRHQSERLKDAIKLRQATKQEVAKNSAAPTVSDEAKAGKQTTAVKEDKPAAPATAAGNPTPTDDGDPGTGMTADGVLIGGDPFGG